MDTIITAICAGVLVALALAIGVIIGARHAYSGSRLGHLLSDDLAVDLWGRKERE